MVIRKLNREKPKLKTLVLLTVLIAIVLLVVFNLFKKPHDDIYINPNLPELPQYKKWESLVITGTLIFDNHFPLYTHIIETKDNKKFGIISKSLNLNDYSWYVEIVWAFETLIKTLPIITISKIKIPEQDLIVDNNVYFFVDALLRFDFSDQVWFKAVKSGENIQVYFNDLLLIDIERFACNKVTKNRNCDNILTDLRYSTAGSFNSYLWTDYYRYETGSWITFNKDIFEYILTPLDDETILDVANVINIIDFKHITTKKQKEITEHCQNGKTWEEKETLTQIEEVTMSHDDPKKVLFIIKWSTDKKNKATCMMTLNLWEDRKTENVMFDIDDNN